MATTRSSSSSREDALLDVRREVANIALPAIVGVGIVAMLLAEGLGWPRNVHFFCATLVLLPLPVWLLSRRSYLLAMCLLVLGCMLSGLLIGHWIPGAAALCLLAMPAILAAVFINNWGGLAVAILSTLLVLSPLGQNRLPADRLPALVVIWGSVGIIWALWGVVSRAIGTLQTGNLRMYGLLEEARDQRLELKQTQQHLIHANRELARLSDRLAALREVAEEARRAKEQFVSNVSHELRTPLNMIVGFSEMIVQAPKVYGTTLPAALMADLNVVLRNAQHLASLINDVLDLSQVEAGRMALTRERVALAGIIDEACSAVERLYGSKGLYLRLKAPADLPPVLCDRTRIREVLLNLLTNAARYTEHGGVDLRLWQEGSDAVVSIADTGPGIAPEDAGKLFVPFQQLDGSIHRRYGGSGLGLAISKDFVELHGGKMWLESEKGQGSTFYFRLPIDPPALPDSPAWRWLDAEWEYRQRTRPATIPTVAVTPRLMIVEEGTALQQLLGRYLGDYELVATASLDQAVDELMRTPAQGLLLNDCSVSAGLQRLAVTNGLPQHIPALVCSIPGLSGETAALNISGYLVKPVMREQLLATLDQLHLDGKTVLVVDDDPETLRLFWRILASSERGYRVLTATDGERALGILREQRPSVLLLDLVMPEMDGFRLLEARNQDPALREIPAVVISAQDPMGQRVLTNALAITQAGGLTAQHLLAYIEVTRRIFAPGKPSGARLQQGMQAG